VRFATYYASLSRAIRGRVSNNMSTSICPFCGVFLSTDGTCPNYGVPGHADCAKPFPTQPEVTFSNTPELLVAVREVVDVLTEIKFALQTIADRMGGHV